VSPAPYRRCCWAARACSSIPPVATSVREVEKGCLGANRLGGTCMHRSGTGASHLSPVAPPAAFKRSTSTGMEDSDTWHFREPDRLAARPSWVSCKITITKMIMTRTPILSPMIPRFTSPPPFDSDGCFCCEASPTLCMAAILAPSTLNHPKGGCITPLKRFKGVSERSPRLPPDQRRNRTLARRALTAECDAGSLAREHRPRRHRQGCSRSATILAAGGRGATSAGHLDGRDCDEKSRKKWLTRPNPERPGRWLIRQSF
jgi:hypothetical protein